MKENEKEVRPIEAGKGSAKAAARTAAAQETWETIWSGSNSYTTSGSFAVPGLDTLRDVRITATAEFALYYYDAWENTEQSYNDTADLTARVLPVSANMDNGSVRFTHDGNRIAFAFLPYEEEFKGYVASSVPTRVTITKVEQLVPATVAPADVDYKQSYLEGGAGNAGAYKVNTHTGRVDFTKELFALGGERMPLAMSVTFNPYISGTHATGMPTGWKLNYQQYVYREGTGYAYIDGNYRRHTFKPLAGTDRYYDEGGHTGLILSFAGGEAQISDERSLTLRFARNTGESGETYDLKYIEEENGSQTSRTSVTYSGNTMTVTDGMDRTATVTFGTGTVTVKRPDGKTITLTVTGGKLTGITEVTGETHAYTYNSYGYPDTVTAGHGQAVVFAYTSGKANVVTEKINGNEVKRYALDYNAAHTDITEYRYGATTKSLMTRYVYADNGEAVSSYEIKDDKAAAIRVKSGEDFQRYMLNVNADGIVADRDNTFSNTGGSQLFAFTSNEQIEVKEGDDCILSAVVQLDPGKSDKGDFDLTVSWGDYMDSGFDPWGSKKVRIEDYDGLQTIALRVPRAMAYDGNPWVGCLFEAPSGHKVEMVITDVKLSARPAASETDCVNVYTNGTRFTEKNGANGTDTTWYELTRCSFGSNDKVKMTGNDWLRTLESYAKNSSDYTVWWDDLAYAERRTGNTEFTFGSKSYYINTINYAKVSERGTRNIFEYNAYGGKYKAVTTQNTVFSDGTGKKCYLRYDNYYRLAETEDSEGAVRTYTYDAYGNVTQEKITAEGKSIVYDSVYGDHNGSGASGKYLTEEKDYLGNVTNTRKYRYNGATGEMTGEISPENLSTSYTYKANGDPEGISATVVTDSGEQTNANLFEYDEQGRLKKIGHNGFVYETYYTDDYGEVAAVDVVRYNDTTEDARYHLISKTYTHTEKTDTVMTESVEDDIPYRRKNEYDVYGRKIAGTESYYDFKLQKEENIYGAITDVTTENTTPTSDGLTKNADSKLRKRIDNGRVTLYNYDSKGNMEKVTRKSGNTSSAETLATSESSYDADNRVSSRKDTVFGKASSATFTYRNGDALNDDKIAICRVKYVSTGIDFDESTSDEYDKFGRLQTRTRGLTYNLTPLFGEVYDYKYFEGPTSAQTTEMLKKVTCTYADNSKTSYTYAYDKNGNISSVIYSRDSSTPGESTATSVLYAYDKLNRLTTIEDNYHFKKYVYTYDAGGNVRTKEEYPFSYGSTGNLLKTTTYEYEEKWTDRLKKITETESGGESVVKTINYENDGYPNNYKGALLTWKNGHLMNYGNGSVTFTYGCDNVRRSKTSNGTTTTYVYDGSRLLGERRVTGSRTVNIQYLYDHTGLIGFLMDGIRYKYGKTPHGDIISVSGNNNVGSYEYDAWGKCTVTRNDNGLADLNPFRYRGYYYDVETKLYYLINRYYDPEIGRFISPDHVGYMMEQMEQLNGCNLYAYCLNNPVMETDPEGTFLFGLVVAALAIKFAVTVVANAVAGGITAVEQGGDFWKGVGAGAIAGVVEGGINLVADIITKGKAPIISSFSRAASSFVYGVTNTLFQNGRITDLDWAKIAADTTMDFVYSMLYVGSTGEMMKSLTDVAGASLSAGVSSLLEIGIDFVETGLLSLAFNRQKEKVKSINA